MCVCTKNTINQNGSRARFCHCKNTQHEQFSQIVSSQRCDCFRHAFARRSYGCEKFAIILSRALKPNHHLGFETFENTVERIKKTRFRFGIPSPHPP